MISGAFLTQWRKLMEDSAVIPTVEECYHFDIFYMSKSGERFASNLLRNFIRNRIATRANDDLKRQLIDDNSDIMIVKVMGYLDKTLFGEVLQTIYGKNWSKLFNIYLNTPEYDVLNPYRMKLEEDSKDDTETNNENSDIENNKVYGFNSTDTPIDSDEVHSSGKSTNTRNEELNRTVNRLGNIGNHTNAELLSDELNFWSTPMWNMIKFDLDKLLTIPVY
jgi:hypothetical protein